MGKIIALANQKGGVAKTTSTINLATAKAKTTNKRMKPNRVLMIDNDPQANLTEHLGLIPDSPEFEGLSVCDLYTHELGKDFDPLDLVFTVDSMPELSLFIIPSTMRLAITDKEVFFRGKGTSYFKKNVREGLAPYFDYIFIDNSPSLSSILIAALSASDSVIIPCKTDRLSMSGLHYLYDTINAVINDKSDAGNPELKIKGVIGTVYKKSQEGNEIVELLQSDKEHPVLGVVPYSTLVNKAFNEGRAVVDARPKSAPSKAYVDISNLI